MPDETMSEYANGNPPRHALAHSLGGGKGILTSRAVHSL
jgi:hypothetical protein